MPPFEGGVGRCVHISPMKFSRKRCSLVPQLCYTVFMGNTVHITVRLPIETVARVDAEALRLKRSRSWVIAWILSDVELFHKEAVNGSSKDADTGRAGSDAAGSDERTGNGAAMPVLRKGKGSKERLHPLPAVRDKLVVGGDGPAGLPESRPSRSASEKCPHGKLNAAYCRATGGGC
jgi:predicted transcriptional regulator